MIMQTTKISKLTTLLIPITLLATTFSTVTRADEIWDQTQKLTAADGQPGDAFGSYVAMEGSIAVIGAPLDDDNGIDSGSAYVINSSTGQQLAKLLPTDGQEDDRFGISVGINGNLAAVSAYHFGNNGYGTGSAYLFDVTTGNQLAKLLTPDGTSNDGYGLSIAVNNNVVAIGAPYADIDTHNGSGAVYVFDATTHQLLYKLSHPAGQFGGDYFGSSVAISGNVAIIGAPGALTAYLYDLVTGQLISQLNEPIDGISSLFAQSVALDGNIAVVGAPMDFDQIGREVGAAYIFDLSNGNSVFKLGSDNPEDGNYFGGRVAVNGNKVLISEIGNSPTGAAFLFDASSGLLLNKLVPKDGQIGENFSSGVAIFGDQIAIGASRSDGIGAVYIFQRRTTNILSVSPEPLIAGTQGTILITNGPPNQNSWLVYSLNGPGEFPVPALNIIIDLTFPQLAVGPTKIDANGNLQWVAKIPNALAGYDIWFQAVQFSNTTNVVDTFVDYQ